MTAYNIRWNQMAETWVPTHATAMHHFVSELQVIAGLMAFQPTTGLLERCEVLCDLAPSCPHVNALVVSELLRDTLQRLHQVMGLSTFNLTYVVTPETFRHELEHVRRCLRHSSSRHIPAFRQVLEKHHADSGLTAKEVAQQMSVSVSHLARLLKRETGHGFRWHLRAVRVEHGKKLLASNRLIIKEVSILAGFARTSEFDRQFRSVVGTTPSRYRACLACCPM